MWTTADLNADLVIDDAAMSSLGSRVERRMKGSILSVLTLLCFAGIVQADTDWKTYPATTCVPDGEMGNAGNDIVYDGFGGICNQSRERDIDIICPIVRDFSRSVMPIEARHAGRTGSDMADLICTLRNMKAQAEDSGLAMAGFFAELEPISMQSNAFFVWQAVSNLKDDPIIESNDFGATILTCRLPKSEYRIDDRIVTSCLYNYSIREWDGK